MQTQFSEDSNTNMSSERLVLLPTLVNVHLTLRIKARVALIRTFNFIYNVKTTFLVLVLKYSVKCSTLISTIIFDLLKPFLISK